jgi:phosphate transport system substrate-binding protein
MKQILARVRWLVVPALAGGLLVATPSGQAVASAPAKSDPATLNASGATFPQPYYEEVIGAFKQKNPDVTINYAGGGSGKGRQDFSDQVVDFAGSDGLFKPEDLSKIKGGQFFYFPTVAAPITVSYNLGVKKLRLSPETIAKIFERQIKTWDDPAIQKDNPGVKLPSTSITVAHRADGSGTTENFTKFLTAAVPGVWTLGSGSTVNWPADTQAGQGNPGVAQIVKNTTGAIGYVDFSDAKALKLKFAAVKNKAGKFVAPTLKATSAAVSKATINADLTYNPLNADGKDAYPIAAPTWLLVYKNQTDAAKGKAIKAFLTFIYGEGQKIASGVDYAPLPKNLLSKAKAQLNLLPAS